jgi:hypothetical protein
MFHSTSVHIYDTTVHATVRKLHPSDKVPNADFTVEIWGPNTCHTVSLSRQQLSELRFVLGSAEEEIDRNADLAPGVVVQGYLHEPKQEEPAAA